MQIKCCKDCVPPARHTGCHGACEKYKAEKAEFEKQKAYIKEHRSIVLTNYDFDEIAFSACKRHKRRNRD